MLCRQTNGARGAAAHLPYSELFAHSCLALLARSEQSSEVVGFCSLHTATGLAALGVSAPKAPDDAHKDSSFGGLYASALLLHPEHEKDALHALLCHAFAASPSLQRITLLAEKQVPLSQPYLAATLTYDAAPDGDAAVLSYSAERASILGSWAVRTGAVEDSDELAPLLQAARGVFGRLAEVCTLPCLCWLFARVQRAAAVSEHGSFWFFLCMSSWIAAPQSTALNLMQCCRM